MSTDSAAGDAAPGDRRHPAALDPGDVWKGDALDFAAERDAGSTSWQRADGLRALVERASAVGWRVTLPGGESDHVVALGRKSGVYVGWCDCPAWEYHDGPCAHLCTLRKAEFVGAETTRGDSVSIADIGPDELGASDGGHRVDRAVGTDPLTGDRTTAGEGRR